MEIAIIVVLALALALTIVTIVMVTSLRQSRQKAAEDMEESIERLKEEIKRSQQFDATCFIVSKFPEQTIVSASPEVKSILGWESDDLIDKSINTIIPADILVLHQDAVQVAITRGSIRPHTIAIQAYALHALGARIPITISLTERSKEPWLVVAQINRRLI